MTELELTNKIKLSCQRALLGAITPNLRPITVGWDGLKFFRLRAYFSEAPSDMEKEEMQAACAEVISDLPFEKDQVECLFSDKKIKDLAYLKDIVFVQKEL